MTFTELAFLPFAAVVLPVYWALPRRALQNAWLLAASLLFYGWRTPWYLLLLVGTALVDWLTALGMARWPERKGTMLAVSLVSNLGLLATFKYLDFFMENLVTVSAWAGHPLALEAPHLPLPVGISFFTFQTLGYTIDVWRGDTVARRNLVDYSTFVAFFPQLVAGPIERANGLLSQVETDRRITLARVASGLGLVLWGAVKKMVVADNVALYVDRVFAMADPSTPLVAAATLGFSVQILADFGGYTDMARGLARMMGFELLDNFRAPYFAASPSEFWKRWHISFSTWIQENVYIPLGGARRGRARRVFATWVSMLGSGLWHGAAWHYVLWGAWHAALLTGWRAVSAFVPRTLSSRTWARYGAIGLMFCFTEVGWLFFREASVSRIFGWFTRSPFAGAWEERVGAVMVLGVAGAGGALLALGGAIRRRWPAEATPLWVRAGLWAAGIVAMVVFSRDVHQDFIYFKF